MNIFSKVSFLDKLLFTKHLSVMIKSGVIISESLAILIEQTKSKTFTSVLQAISTDIQNGQPLAKAMARHPQVFDQFYVSLIEVGEESGTLEETLEFLVKQLSADYSMRKKVQGAMMYPTIVFVAIVLMGGGISFFILPQLVDFFSAFDIELPLPTRILLVVSQVMKSYGIFIGIGSVVGLILFRILIQLPSIKPTWHRTLLRIPLIGPFMADVNIARFCRNLGTMLGSGVPLLRCLETTAHTMSNITYQRELLAAREDVRAGLTLAASIERHRFMPPLVSKMIAIGEKTGKLEDVLAYLAEFYEEEIDEFSKNLSTILEPVLLIGIGLVVGFVAVAIIGPIYQLTGSLH